MAVIKPRIRPENKGIKPKSGPHRPKLFGRECRPVLIGYLFGQMIFVAFIVIICPIGIVSSEDE